MPRKSTAASHISAVDDSDNIDIVGDDIEDAPMPDPPRKKITRVPKKVVAIAAAPKKDAPKKAAPKKAAPKKTGSATKKAVIVEDNDSDKEDAADNDSDDDLNKKARDEDEIEDDIDDMTQIEDDDVDEEVYDDIIPTGDSCNDQNTDVEYEYVKAEDRATVGILGPYAAAAMLAIRTEQIARTGLTTVDKTGCDTNEDIARRELLEGKLPIMLRRIAGSRIVDGKKVIKYELWRTEEMVLPIDV